MKKVFLCVVGITLFVVACKKDDAAPDYTNLIVDKWFYINQIGLFTPSGGVAERDTLVFNNGSYLEFLANKKFTLYVKDSFATHRDSGTYSLAGNQFYATSFSGLKDTCTIQYISSSNLTFYYNDLSTQAQLG